MIEQVGAVVSYCRAVQVGVLGAGMLAAGGLLTLIGKAKQRALAHCAPRVILVARL